MRFTHPSSSEMIRNFAVKSSDAVKVKASRLRVSGVA
jgi:hypothetical protein